LLHRRQTLLERIDPLRLAVDQRSLLRHDLSQICQHRLDALLSVGRSRTPVALLRARSCCAADGQREHHARQQTTRGCRNTLIHDVDSLFRPAAWRRE
jgi:hypothetical protein